MDAKKTVIFVVVGGVGVWLTYRYLDENGYLHQWFPNSFPAPGGGSTPAGPLSSAVVHASDLSLLTQAHIVLTPDQLAALNTGQGATLTAAQLAAFNTWVANMRATEAAGGAAIPVGTLPAPAPSNVTPISNAPPIPLLDVSGLSVVPDINDSFRGTVKIAGVPMTLAIIKSDGRIFDTTGSEVSDALSARGVDVNILRAAFMAAGSGMSGAGMGGYRADLSRAWAT